MSIPDPVVLLDARARYVHPAFQMSRASTKTVFDSAGRLVTVPANALGWDHDPATGQARGYLAEPGAKNLLQHSNDLSDSVWSKSALTVTTDAIVGPDGEGMAKLVDTVDNQQHFIYQNFTLTDGSPVVLSLIVKLAELERLRFQVTEVGPNNTVLCEIAAGTAENARTYGTAELSDFAVEALGGGFYRCWVSGTLGAGVTNCRTTLFLMKDGTTVYQGDGSSGLYVGKLQVEENSRPTSYIETGATTAERVGDALRLPSLDVLPQWQVGRGALLVEGQATSLAPFGRLFELSGNNLLVRRSGVANGSYLLDGSVLDQGQVLVNTAYERNLVAVSWRNGEGVSAVINGEVVADRPMTTALSEPLGMGLGAQPGGAALSYGGHIRRAVYYPASLSNADLQSLTAIQE